MSTRINDEDMRHLLSFPGTQKATVMQKIMASDPAETVTLEGDNDFEKTLLRLRSDGFGLIDLQPHETVIRTVWYRKNSAFLIRRREDVAMLMWEQSENGDSTTLMTWRV